MTPEDEAEIAKLMRDARKNSRGYADFFLWAIDRDLEELAIVRILEESLILNQKIFFTNPISRGRTNDPPDCEALNLQGERVAIEVTELVDNLAIHDYKKAIKEGKATDWAEWTKSKFLHKLQVRITAKDNIFKQLKGAPYSGGYFVVIHSDEMGLNSKTVLEYLTEHQFLASNINRAFLLLSYDPSVRMYPYYELQLIS